MLRLNLSIIATVLLLESVTGISAPAVDRATRASVDAFEKKIIEMSRQGAAPARRGMRTTVTEQELNAYLLHGPRMNLPAGVANPAVSLLASTGRVSGRAVVDLDRVRKEKRATSWFDPVSYLTGRLPVTATGLLTVRDGVGQFTFESASVAGVPVPKLFVQQIVAHYSKSATRPSGISIDQPFALPAHIHEIRFGRGEATVIQQ